MRAIDQPRCVQVGHALGEANRDIHVGKVDCTRFTTVANAMNIRGFPTIKFFRNGQIMEYDGERTKAAMIDFALKAAGPAVRRIGTVDEFATVAKRHAKVRVVGGRCRIITVAGRLFRASHRRR